jgi:hypothetical protein
MHRKSLPAKIRTQPAQTNMNNEEFAQLPRTVKTLPSDMESEAQLLCCCMIGDGTEIRSATAAGITEQSFYEPTHAAIYHALRQLDADKSPSFDASAVYLTLRDTAELNRAGGLEKITQVSGLVPTTALTTKLIKTTVDMEFRRRLARLGDSLAEHSRNGFSADDLRSELAAAIAHDSKLNQPLLVSRDISTFSVPPDNDPTVLLGNRFLCRGDGLVLSSSAGMGKSSLTIQSAVTWSLAHPCLGIAPNGELRSLVYQAEDSDGDIGEIWASVCHKMQLTHGQRAAVAERVKIVTDRVNRGPSFLQELRRQVTAAPYDLVWINPLMAFMSGDSTTAKDTSDFFRAGLNAINTPASFGYIVVQHTTKPQVGKERGSDRKWNEIMYDMAGSYDIIGWARAIISLRPTSEYGEFNLVLAKRGLRAGVTKKVPQGAGWRLEATTSIPLKHSTEKMKVPGVTREVSVIFWEPRDETPGQEQPAAKPEGRPKTHTLDTFRSIFPTLHKDAIGVNDLLRQALKIKCIGKNALYGIIDEALATGFVICDTSNPKSTLYYAKPSPVSTPPNDLLDPNNGQSVTGP